MVFSRVPAATYRLQLNQNFGFAQAAALVSYLNALGVSDVYLSPILQARQGSLHGYDVANPLRLNPELGGEQELEAVVEQLRSHRMGLLLDIVANHMAACTENPWWVDLLELGRASKYAVYFDIDWDGPSGSGILRNRIFLPLLEESYGRVLERGGFRLHFDGERFCIRYWDSELPLYPRSYGTVLAHGLDDFLRGVRSRSGLGQRVVRLVRLADSLPRADDASGRSPENVRRMAAAVKREAKRLFDSWPEASAFVVRNLRVFNGKKGRPESFGLMDRLLEEQAYRLADWRKAGEVVGYRRFFDIGGLVGVRVEDAAVFEDAHALILQLVKEGKVTGLRLDHIDGLYDPEGYLRRLQGSLGFPRNGESFFVVVEKILAPDERLPKEWLASGTTGYDFLDSLNNVFVDQKGLERLRKIYAGFTGSATSGRDLLLRCKRKVIRELFGGELGALRNLLARLASADRHARDLRTEELAAGLAEVTADLPVYRTYIRGFEVSEQDRRYIQAAVEQAARDNPSISGSVFDFLRRLLSLDFPLFLSAKARQDWLGFVMRWQQFSGPVMAKGLEDTTFYIYNPLVSLNEVGGEPAHDRLSVAAFHRLNKARVERWPDTLNATSTHDTKRSEDVRARIHVLSETPGEWADCVKRWARWNRSSKQEVGRRTAPNENEEILLYQTLIGAWPLQAKEVPQFRRRLDQYMVKALREAKVQTSWLVPDLPYERGVLGFLQRVLSPSATNMFLKDFVRFQEEIAWYGALNSLGQVVLKTTSPGVPDFYQGMELWDFSLADPDNRRVVDFEKRKRFLRAFEKRKRGGIAAVSRQALARWKDGRVKLYVTHRALQARAIGSKLFHAGDYISLEAKGLQRRHVCAFARRNGYDWAITAVPRLLTRLVPYGQWPVGVEIWKKTALVLPDSAPIAWRNVFTGEVLSSSRFGRGHLLFVGQMFKSFPFALLTPVRAAEAAAKSW